MISEYTAYISAEQVKAKEKVIFENLPKHRTTKDLSCIRTPNGVEIYAHKGIPFLEMHPLEFGQKRDGDKYVITCTQKYRVLK